MKKAFLLVLIALSANSYAEEEFFYECADGTKAHQYVNQDGNAVLEFHGLKLNYKGVNMGSELSFNDDNGDYLKSNRLSMKALTETRFKMDLLSKKSHYETECEVVSLK